MSAFWKRRLQNCEAILESYNTGVSPKPARMRQSDIPLHAPSARGALAGFFLAGILLALPGALLPVWGHHLTPALSAAGSYFLAVGVGLWLSKDLGSWLLARKSVSFALAFAGVLACAALLCLVLVPASLWPPARALAMAIIGLSSGLMITGVIRPLERMYQHDAPATANMAGLFFGAGCLASVLFLARSAYAYSPSTVLLLLAAIPGGFAIVYARTRFLPVSSRAIPASLERNKSPERTLFTALVMVQFANEWSIAGWLAIFLIQQVGMSPQSALWLLALY